MTITLNIVWMEREFDAYKLLTNCLAAFAHLTISVSEIERDTCEKIVILSYTLAFDAPIRGVPVGESPPRLVRKNYNGVATRW